MARPAQPKPLWLCGCGHPVRRRSNRYASVGCVPRVSRSEGGRLGRQKGSFLHRMRKYRAQIEAVKRTGRIEVGRELYYRVPLKTDLLRWAWSR